MRTLTLRSIPEGIVVLEGGEVGVVNEFVLFITTDPECRDSYLQVDIENKPIINASSLDSIQIRFKLSDLGGIIE